VWHRRGQWRQPLARQLTDPVNLIAPYNVLMYLFSAVPNRPMLSVRDFPELNKLRDNWQVIRDEALALFD
jgi:beta-hydroxylase